MFFSAKKRITYVSQAVHFTSIESRYLGKTTVQMLARFKKVRSIGRFPSVELPVLSKAIKEF